MVGSHCMNKYVPALAAIRIRQATTSLIAYLKRGGLESSATAGGASTVCRSLDITPRLSPSNFVTMASASASRPFPANQRGDSGIARLTMRRSKHDMPGIANIPRQLYVGRTRYAATADANRPRRKSAVRGKRVAGRVD